MTRELICGNEAGSASTGARVAPHAKTVLIPAIASLCLAAAWQAQAQEAARTPQPVPASPAQEPAGVVLPMTVIAPASDGARDAQGDTRFRPKADITGNCGRVIFRKAGRAGLSNDYSVRVISSMGPMATIFYTAWTYGDMASGAVPAYGDTDRFFAFTLYDPFDVTALLHGFIRTVSGVDCIYFPNPA